MRILIFILALIFTSCETCKCKYETVKENKGTVLDKYEKTSTHVVMMYNAATKSNMPITKRSHKYFIETDMDVFQVGHDVYSYHNKGDVFYCEKRVRIPNTQCKKHN